MINKEVEFKIPFSAMMNMIDVYAKSKAFCLDRITECETDEDYNDLDDNPNYQYYYGRTEMAEHWLNLCGVSPQAYIIQKAINNYLQYKFD